MIRSCLPLILAAVLLTAGAAVDPAHAQSCFSANEARAAGSGIVPLSSVLNKIRAATGGEILANPQLCNIGGRLVYLINVLVGGRVRQVQVDGTSGTISY